MTREEFFSKHHNLAFAGDYWKLHQQEMEDKEKDLKDYPEEAINTLLGIQQPKPNKEDKEFLENLKKWKEKTQLRSSGTYATTPKTIGVEIDPRPFYLNPYQDLPLGGIWEEPIKRKETKIIAIYDPETRELIGTETLNEIQDLTQETITTLEQLLKTPELREIWNTYKNFYNLTSIFDLHPQEAQNLIAVLREELREINAND